jgi:hypothetical protein
MRAPRTVCSGRYSVRAATGTLVAECLVTHERNRGAGVPAIANHRIDEMCFHRPTREWRPADRVFVTADEIAKAQWPQDHSAHACAVASKAAATRGMLIKQGRSLTGATVFSHQSKRERIDAAHPAGYTVVLNADSRMARSADDRFAELLLNRGLRVHTPLCSTIFGGET